MSSLHSRQTAPRAYLPGSEAPRMALLTVGNPKVAKGRAKGYAVAVLHLAPHTLGGRNVCPAATPGCIASCLNLAGRGGLAPGAALTHAEVATGARTNPIQAARMRRTALLWGDRPAFAAALLSDATRFAAWARANGWQPVLRLNGTSDLDFDAVLPGVVAALRDLGVIRYDYTKVRNRMKRAAPDYSLTFSLAEGNDAQAADWLRAGGRAAAVLRVRKGQPLPATLTLDGQAFPVVDGDVDDLRFLDPEGVVVGLRAKGPAKRDRSGFVRDVH